MNLVPKKCANPTCSQMFRVWEKEIKEHYYCSEHCHAYVLGGKTFWGKEDRRATAIKEERKCHDKKEKE